MRRAAATVLLAGLLGGCDGPASPRERFAQDVAPVLEARCAATVCHGVGPDAEARGEVVDWGRLFFRVDARGRIADLDAAYAATKRAIVTDEDADFSSLLRKPLPAAWGGLPHHGGDNFTSPDDPAYRAVRGWIESETGGGEDEPPLDEGEALFAETVQPALVSAMCTNANCHGPEAAVPFRLDPGIGGRFSRAATRANYESALAMLSLDGDPLQSRLLRKALPLHDGGIAHKGGNGLLTGRATDPRVENIRRWACAERRARLGPPCHPPGGTPIAGFLFVRGPVAPRDTFDLDAFVPGSDLWFARVNDASLIPVEVTNLTARFHDEPADIRDPAVDPTGRKVAFAMRLSAEGGHDLYELDLVTLELRRLTDDAGPLPDGGVRTYRDPTYGPRGHVWFVSTRAGVLADGGDVLDAELYELDPDTGAITRRTWTPHVERKPVFLVHGEENGGEVAFTALREAVPAAPLAHPFRFPPDLKTEYHQHFGITPPEDLFHDLRELPDGRYVVTLGDLDGVWRAGRLGIVDRNFGPEIPAALGETPPGGPQYATHAVPGPPGWHTLADGPPGLPFYAPPLTRLDPEAADAGITHGLYRDPAPLPDGRLLVAYAPQTVDLSDPLAEFDLRIEVLTLAEAVDGSGPRIADRAVLVDAPGVADRDPEPVYVRRPAPVAEEDAWDPAADTGLLLHNGLPLIDALLASLPPAGRKVVRDDFRYVRLVEALPARPADRRPIPSWQTLGRDTEASTVGLGRRGAARILAELPLAPDGTFQVEVPAGVPFRIQGLDADRMALGAMHNRWFYVAPGQRLVQGASPREYPQRCAACHGALDGDPAHAFVVPDVLTTASLTLGRYADQDPRRPLPAPRAGDETRIEVDFQADVRPILDRACATDGCHAGSAPAAGLRLDATPTRWFDVAYEGLLAGGRYVDYLVGSARRSYLIEKLTGRELDAPRALDTPGVPHPAPDGLPAEDLLTLVRWIDLGATWRGRP